MDQNRRQASGTLAELLGPSALGNDASLRTLGLRRAAQRSLDAVSRLGQPSGGTIVTVPERDDLQTMPVPETMFSFLRALA